MRISEPASPPVPKPISRHPNWVATAPHGLILSQDGATASRKLSKHLQAPFPPAWGPKTSKNIENRRLGGGGNIYIYIYIKYPSLSLWNPGVGCPMNRSTRSAVHGHPQPKWVTQSTMTRLGPGPRLRPGPWLGPGSWLGPGRLGSGLAWALVQFHL